MGQKFVLERFQQSLEKCRLHPGVNFVEGYPRPPRLEGPEVAKYVERRPGQRSETPQAGSE